MQATKKLILSFILMAVLMMTLFSFKTQAVAANTTVATFTQLQQAINNAPINGTEYIIEITANINLTTYISIPSGRNIIIRSAASGGPFVLTQSTSRHFSLTSCTLTLANIILDGGGGTSATCGGVEVNSGNFKMLDGAVIKNCYSSTSGAAVWMGGGTFTMDGGIITGNRAQSAGAGVLMNTASCTFTMNGGVITGNTTNGSTNAGSGVFVRGSFYMYGGEISNNTTATASGCGVFVYQNATFIMGDPSGLSNGKPVISGNISPAGGGGVYVNTGCSFTMYSGEIKGNTAKTSGGGVYVNSGTFDMLGGTISQNKTTGTSQGGGGVYVNSSTFNMSGGIINENITYLGQNGGGVYILSSGTFNMSGNAVIQKCTADVSGGGVYVNAGTFDIKDTALIKNCKATTGGGVCAVNSNSKITMSGGTIKGNEVTSNGGGVYLNGSTFNMYENSVIEECEAANGGGVYLNATSNFIMKNAVIQNCASTSNGGGIYSTNTSTVNITGAAIIGNTVGGSGGGIYTADTSYAKLSIDNTTAFSGNFAGNGAYVYTGTGSYPATQRVPTIDFPVSTSIAIFGTEYYGDLFKLSKDYSLNNYDVNYTSLKLIIYYKIAYDANGGSGTVSDANEYPQDSNANILSGNGFSKPGYSFITWNTSPDGSGTEYPPNDTISMTGNITLYAQWKENDYIVCVSLYGSASWEDLGGNLALTFSSGTLRQTAIFNPSITEYTGHPQAGATNGIAMLSARNWEVALYLPIGYRYKIYKDGAEVANTLTMTEDDTLDCQIEVKIFKETNPPWGKQIYKYF